jgi:hypothetical protein
LPGCLAENQTVRADDNSAGPKELQMEVTLKTGTILMKEGTLLPAGLEAASDAFLPGWRAFQNLSAYALSRKIEADNWHFFCLAGVVHATAVGPHRQKTLTRAVKHILASTTMEKYNSLEVTEITSKWFLGVPYLQGSSKRSSGQERGSRELDATCGTGADARGRTRPGKIDHERTPVPAHCRRQSNLLKAIGDTE